MHTSMQLDQGKLSLKKIKSFTCFLKQTRLFKSFKQPVHTRFTYCLQGFWLGSVFLTNSLWLLFALLLLFTLYCVIICCSCSDQLMYQESHRRHEKMAWLYLAIKYNILMQSRRRHEKMAWLYLAIKYNILMQSS